MSQGQQFLQPYQQAPEKSKAGLFIGIVTAAVVVVLLVMYWPEISAELASRKLLPVFLTDKPIDSKSVPVTPVGTTTTPTGAVVPVVASTTGKMGTATAVSFYANTAKPPQTLSCPTGKVLKTGYGTYNSTARPSCYKSITLPQVDGKNSYTFGPDFTPWIPAGTCDGDNMNLIFQYECV